MLLLLLLLFTFFSKPCFAQLNICGFSSSTTSDKVNICNNSGQTIDISNYSIWDGVNNKKNLFESSCLLSTQDYISINFSNYLNKLGDYILLKQDDDVIDCVSYGDSNCPGIGLHVDVADSKCNQLVADQWTMVDNCDFSKENNCILPIEPSSTPSPTITLSTPTPTSTPIPTPAPEFTFTDAPDDIEVGKTFSLSFEIKNATPNLVFHIKGFDIDNPTYTQTQNGDNWLNYSGSNGAWDAHPSFTTDSSGNSTDSINLRFRSDKGISPDYPSRLRLKSDTLGESGNIQVVVVKVPLAPTNIPTSTPKPTSSITPTHTLTLTPTPSNLTPSPTNTSTPSATPTDRFQPQILGATTTEPPSPPKDPRRILPIIFMVTGGLFLTTPALITKFKKIKKK